MYAESKVRPIVKPLSRRVALNPPQSEAKDKNNAVFGCPRERGTQGRRTGGSSQPGKAESLPPATNPSRTKEEPGQPEQLMTTLPPFVSAVKGRLMMALKFFELGRLSLGLAAEVAGYSKRAFMDVLGQYGIPVADYPASELSQELAW